MKASTIKWLIWLELTSHGVWKTTALIAWALVWSQTSGFPRVLFTALGICWSIDKLLEGVRMASQAKKDATTPREVQVKLNVEHLDIGDGMILDGEDEKEMRAIWARAQAKRRAGKAGVN